MRNETTEADDEALLTERRSLSRLEQAAGAAAVVAGYGGDPKSPADGAAPSANEPISATLRRREAVIVETPDGQHF